MALTNFSALTTEQKTVWSRDLWKMARNMQFLNRFAGKDGVKGVARYENARWSPLETGALALEDAVASVDCRVDEFIERHSHVIVLGTVQAIRLQGGEPLVYSRGRYGAFAPA